MQLRLETQRQLHDYEVLLQQASQTNYSLEARNQRQAMESAAKYNTLRDNSFATSEHLRAERAQARAKVSQLEEELQVWGLSGWNYNG